VRQKAERVLHLRGHGRSSGHLLASGHSLSDWEWAARNYILEDPWFLTRVVMGFHWVDEELHGRHLLSHYFRENDEGVLSADHFDKATFIPRGHIKTLQLGCAIGVIWRILNNPQIGILYGSATDSLSKDVGLFISGTLLHNEILQACFPDILPKSKNECEQWGIRGYRLPCSKRKDATLICTSMGAVTTGKHPDITICDDLIVPQNNNQLGWTKAFEFIKTCLALLPPHGILEVLGTRYNDADTYSRIISGEIRGKQGVIETLVESCYVDDDPEKGPIWPAKKRWTSNIISGYTVQQLEDMRFTMGSFFNAQMRNDPVPEGDQVIRIHDVNTFTKDQEPTHGRPARVGIDEAGGGTLIINTLKEELQKLYMTMPIRAVSYKKGKRSVDGAKTSKEDQILSAIEPVIRSGNLWIRDSMMPENDADTDKLGYEIKRLGAARYDDQVDVLHLIEKYLIKGRFPAEGQTPHMYIGCDLAFTESRTSDYTAIMAVVVTPDKRRWVIDIDRFRAKSPMVIANRIISFYRKHDVVSERDKRAAWGKKKKSFAASYK
jgi:hypothetical protein